MAGAINRTGLERARLNIAHLEVAETKDAALLALERAAAITATALDVARVSIWFFSPDRSELIRAVLHTGGEVDRSRATVELGACPSYRDAVESDRVVAADDVRTDPRTRELAGYLEEHGITSMLDVPIVVGGDRSGLVCLEHTGPLRRWTLHETDFAISVADMVAALLERGRRVQAEIELREREAADAKARKRDALVRMTAGIAHDFNTVLQTILLTTEHAKNVRDEGERRELGDVVIAECERGARLVRQLSDYANARRAAPGDGVDLASVVADMEGTMHRVVGERRALRVDIEKTPLFVHANRAQIERLVINLVANAGDATGEGGHIGVRVTDVHGRARLEVTDDGAGIDPSLAERVFEPFFTTKGTGKGTGLGLSIVAAIVEDAGGTVRVGNAEGRGTRFVVDLPLESSDAAS